ncbi:MAG TPA: arginine repressor [Phycisphaerae bacterium]
METINHTDKRRRQSALLRLVQEQRVGNQREIVALMRGSGLAATQASISRDIRELGLVKMAGRYIPADGLVASGSRLAPGDPLLGLIKSVEPIGANLIIIRTTTGSASSVAVALDNKRLPEVAGTLAGDDTIFVAVRSRSVQGRVVALLNAWMQST